jgi:hypothetical protein
MGTDEQDARIAAAFRAAAADAPPPGFDAGDVVAASRRITRRRRSALAGAALAVLAVAGVGLGVGLSGPRGSELTTASAGSAPAPARDEAAPGGAGQAGAAADAGKDAAAPEAARAAAPPAPAAGSAAGGGVAGAAVPGASGAGEPPAVGAPLGPGTGECANRQDPALRTLVEQALPEVVGAPEAVVTQECRPGGERGVALEVRDGATSGVLEVTVLPSGEEVPVPAGARDAPTASDGTVIVASRAQRAGEPAPFAARLDAVVAYLAPRL